VNRLVNCIKRPSTRSEDVVIFWAVIGLAGTLAWEVRCRQQMYMLTGGSVCVLSVVLNMKICSNIWFETVLTVKSYCHFCHSCH
jgi:hypothetical protein